MSNAVPRPLNVILIGFMGCGKTTVGQLLARQLAESALAERTTAPADMAAHLATPPAPSIEMLTAVYFQTVAAANAGWTR